MSGRSVGGDIGGWRTVGPRSRRLVKVGRVLWVLFAIVLWNVIFDVHVQLAAIRYVAAQQHYQAGHGARQSIAAFMEPAVRAGFRRATLWSGLIAVAGLGAFARAARRPRPEHHA